ncbi:hypothetical protein [Paraburkholderia sp. SG-MS1]|uniref:hypothetical protein n=1 Tax=Paraburkholderia sp. SG-MS1 TaxID=2023741 RepID=UPI00144511D7|nr:hypothetical protein [Paraburkholderia sp. SG-MS1]
MSLVETVNAGVNRTNQGSGKICANGLRKGFWPILTNRYSLKPTLNALRNLGAPTHQTNGLINNRVRIKNFICS